jgi:Zn-dependent protease
LYDYTAQQLVLRLAIVLLLIALQGGAVAATAAALGDKGVQHDGRRTLSPLPHLDLIGLLSALFFGVGWIKPIAIDARLLRGGRAALPLPVLAGFLAILALVPLLLALRAALLSSLPDTAAQTLFAFVTAAGPLAISFALGNLLPLPPFTGGLLLQAVSPSLARALWRMPILAGLVMLGLAWLGLFGSLLAPVERWLGLMLLRQ